MEKRNLVVGKFMPLHAGHVSLLKAAAESCEKLVIFSYSNPNYVGFQKWKREKWLRRLFPEAEIFSWDQEDIDAPSNFACDLEQQEFAAELYVSNIGKALHSVYCNDSYCGSFAKVLSLRLQREKIQTEPVLHIQLDPERKVFPISGSKLREKIRTLITNPLEIDPEVLLDLVPRILFLGAESTGKSSLVKVLSEKLQGAAVEEYGRELWEEKSGKLEFDDLLKIAKTQIEHEVLACKSEAKIVLCDTSPLTTLLYSQAMFNDSASELQELSERPYDLVYLCSPDFPLVQDGTRRDEKFRQWQHDWYLRELKQRAIPFELLTGTFAEKCLLVQDQCLTLQDNWLLPALL